MGSARIVKATSSCLTRSVVTAEPLYDAGSQMRREVEGTDLDVGRVLVHVFGSCAEQSRLDIIPAETIDHTVVSVS